MLWSLFAKNVPRQYCCNMNFSPVSAVRHGRPAAEVCKWLKHCPPAFRELCAIDAIVAAAIYGRVDTFKVLAELKTPLCKQGALGLSAVDALYHVTQRSVAWVDMITAAHTQLNCLHH